MLPRHLQKQPHGPDWPAPHTRPVGTYFARGGRSSAPLTPSPSGTVEVSRHSDDATLGSKAPAQFCESHITARSAAVHRHMVHIRRRGAAQTRDENTMVRSLILTAALTVGLATVAQAGLRRIRSAIRTARSYASPKDADPDGGAVRADAAIRWRKAVLARGDTTSGRKVSGAGRGFLLGFDRRTDAARADVY